MSKSTIQSRPILNFYKFLTKNRSMWTFFFNYVWRVYICPFSLIIHDSHLRHQRVSGPLVVPDYTSYTCILGTFSGRVLSRVHSVFSDLRNFLDTFINFRSVFIEVNYTHVCLVGTTPTYQTIFLLIGQPLCHLFDLPFTDLVVPEDPWSPLPLFQDKTFPSTVTTVKPPFYLSLHFHNQSPSSSYDSDLGPESHHNNYEFLRRSPL